METVRYAGFFRRLGALLIDTVILAALGFFTLTLQGRTVALDISLMVALFVVGLIYMIGFVAKFGATPGKMLIGIQIRRLDLGKAGLKEAFLRHSVDALYSVVNTTLAIVIIVTILPATLSWTEKVKLFSLTPMGKFQDYLNIAALIWGLSELVVLLTNEKRRGINDFIAGTVVIVKKT